MAENSTIPEFAQNSVNLASPRLGSEAVYATDEFFAPKERMLSDQAAVFYADKYDDNGKWMDGWESRRRRDTGHDFCIIRLGVKGVIKGVDIDTSFFTGNFPPAASIEACVSDAQPDDDAAWLEIVPPTTLLGDQHNYIAVNNEQPFNYLRLNMLPDGGIARLRVYGEAVCELENSAGPVELSSVLNGGRVVAFNDSHYGDPWVILTPGRGANMGDGWETRRRREPGNDWIIVALGHPGEIESIEIDTAHFKGNYPDSCSVQAAFVDIGTEPSVVTQSMFWPVVLEQQKLEMDKQHFFKAPLLTDTGPITHVRLNIHPDGGISRMRIIGRSAKNIGE